MAGQQRNCGVDGGTWEPDMSKAAVRPQAPEPPDLYTIEPICGCGHVDVDHGPDGEFHGRCGLCACSRFQQSQGVEDLVQQAYEAGKAQQAAEIARLTTENSELSVKLTAALHSADCREGERDRERECRDRLETENARIARERDDYKRRWDIREETQWGRDLVERCLKSEAENARLRAAFSKFVAEFEAVLPAINNMCVLEHVHGRPYSGPTVDLEGAKKALGEAQS